MSFKLTADFKHRTNPAMQKPFASMWWSLLSQEGANLFNVSGKWPVV